MYRRDRSGPSRSHDRDGRGSSRDRDRDRQYGLTPPREVRDSRDAERAGLQWVRVDMHLHTPASSDYRDPDATYLKILQRAEERGLDIIALTDHNSVQGYAQMLEEIRTLEMLEARGRLNDDEAHDLAEYRRLRETLLVLPGFEFTATFGFHILGIFPPGTSLRKLEIVLLKLDVPEHKMLAGAPDAGPTSDVIEAYEAISEAGGLAIAAHANSSNGVAMQGFNFGGQTKIAYTQHPALAALEVTDLDQTGRRTTESFFNGSKPEYPRRMHCIQGSDAHSIDKEPGDGANKRLGVGDRCTELLLPDITFEAMRDLFASKDFDRIRPYRPGEVAVYDFVRQARAQGPSIVQAFHERASTKTTRTRGVLKDVAAFANSGGGTIYLGVSADESLPVRGVDGVDETVQMLRFDIQRGIVPPLDVSFATHTSEGRPVLLLQVPSGPDKPYMFEPAGQIYLRQEADSVPATRDDIVRLVLEAHDIRQTAQLAAAALSVPETESAATADALEEAEIMAAEMVEDAVAGTSVPLDLAHRRKRRRRRGGDRPGDAAADAGAAPADELTDAVPAWTTTPAWEGPEDNPTVTDAEREAAASRALEEVAGIQPGPALPASWTEADAESDAEPRAAAGGRRRRRGRGGAAEASVEAEAAAVPEPEPQPAPEPVTQAPAEETAPEPAAPEAPPPRRKGLLYQVYRSELGEPEVGNAQRERRRGLYADQAGELLTVEVRAANPDAMFEMERNQMWAPEGTPPEMPAGLTARQRSKTAINDTVLNARSGPGGQFRSMAELAPLPDPEPEPEPEPAAPAPKPSRARGRGAKAAAPADVEARPESEPAPEPQASEPRPARGRGGRRTAAAEAPVAPAPAPVGPEPDAAPAPTRSRTRARGAKTETAPAAAPVPEMRAPAPLPEPPAPVATA
ncbi:MAG TPA: RNA-binding domain-containing protein, partial [Chloroflexia bacterium]|nr:RNA-binding domain-containing protein [Chloroflexia bacterium]